MRRTIPQIRSATRGLAAILIACLLALRVAALPMVMAEGAPGPGMMAICTGAEIIYIPIGSQSMPVEGTADDGEPQHDPCPAFGITAALLTPDQPFTAPTRAATTARTAPMASLWANGDGQGPYHSRAPPRLRS